MLDIFESFEELNREILHQSRSRSNGMGDGFIIATIASIEEVIQMLLPRLLREGFMTFFLVDRKPTVLGIDALQSAVPLWPTVANSGDQRLLKTPVSRDFRDFMNLHLPLIIDSS